MRMRSNGPPRYVRPSAATTSASTPRRRSVDSSAFARAGWTSTAVTWAPLAASTAVLPPGAAHRSSTRRPGPAPTRWATRTAARAIGTTAPAAKACEPATSSGPPTRRTPVASSRTASAPASSSQACSAASPSRSGFGQSDSAGARLAAAHSARARSSPYASNQSSAIQSGSEWRRAASSGVSSGSAAYQSGPSRATRRRTALTRPVARGPISRRASSTLSETAACGGIPSANRIWKTPSCSTCASRRSSRCTGRPAISSRAESSVRRR